MSFAHLFDLILADSTPETATPKATEKPTLLLVDGHSLAYRAYYAFSRGPDGGLRTSSGIPTSATYGFLTLLMDVMDSERPDYAAAAFDSSAPTFRHDVDVTYKADRPEAPDDFREDIKNLQALLTLMRVPILMLDGYEADDVLGTTARKAAQDGYRVKILSGDQDMFQLIDPEQGISVLHMGSALYRAGARVTEFGPQQVQEKLGIRPDQVVDYKALCGDTSDNIPGVKGIGQKTAVKLLDEYGSLQNIYASIDQIKGATRKKLEEGHDDAMHSQYMAQIHLGVPIDVSLTMCKLEGFDEAKVVQEFKRLEFQSFIKRIGKIQTAFGGEVEATETSGGAEGKSAIAPPSPFFDDDDISFFTFEDTLKAQAAPDENVTIKPQIVRTTDELDELIQRLKQHTDPKHPTAWDTETTALDPWQAQLVGIGCCWGEEAADMAYIPVGHTVGKSLDVQTVLERLRSLLEDPAYPKAFQNAKFDRLVLRCQGVDLKGVVFDPMLASYVINPESSHNLTDMALRYFGLEVTSYTDLVPKKQTIADVSIPAVANYCGMDVHLTYRLVPLLQAQLEQVEAFPALLHEIELPLEPVLADMEYTGIRIDQEYLRKLSVQLEKNLQEIEQQAYEDAGETFNLGSPKQLSELFFDKLGLDKRKSRKMKTGYSTDAATLEKLQGDHPVVDAVVEFRTLSKLKSTYVDALPELVNPKTGRVHTDFNQAITTTGRLSSSNPNLQNIPIRTAFSRQIRAAFIPEPGWILAAADYSQIELRILAHLSGEPVLVETYRNNDDVHALTARLLFEKDDVTPDERRLGKTINFGVIYGMGASRFAREAGVSRADAKMFIDRFNERYPLVFGYLQQMQKNAIANNYVETIKGRRRYFNFTSGSLKRLQGKSPDEIDLQTIRPGGYDAGLLRAAANAPIQGSSADIIKIAMVQIQDLLKSYETRLLLQVHDELVFEAPPDEWAELSPKIQTAMESAVQLEVPLRVEVHAGQNWMETK
ncbi:MAG: DNA polymerase I [Thainema sp.]